MKKYIKPASKNNALLQEQRPSNFSSFLLSLQKLHSPILSRRGRQATFLLLLLVSFFLPSCRKFDQNPPITKNESADILYSWYRFAAKMQLLSAPQPVVLLLNRNFGYIGVGLYESVRPGIKKGESLSSVLYQMPLMPQINEGEEYLWSASANAAMASMLKKFLTGLTTGNNTSIDSMENAQNNVFRHIASDAVIARSQTFGRAIAEAIYNWSTTDNFTLSSEGYVLPVFPGAWELTPPAFPAPVGPFLKNSRPFLAYSLTALAPPLPLPYSEEPSSDFYKAAKDVYDVGKNLTDEQKAIANWWADAGGAGVGVPAPYHVLGIVTSILESQRVDLAKAAEVYAKTGIAMKDGPINTFRTKYHYNLVRPVTYIRSHIDPNWLSYLPTPPYPEYTSGLAGIVTPLFQVLVREFGDIPVNDDAYIWRGLPVRHFTSISQMTEEALVSRIYGGLHYRFTQYISWDFGRQLGNVIADINLKRIVQDK